MKDHESRWSLFFKTASYIYLFFVIGMVQGVIGPSLALLKQHTNVSESAIETIVVARGVGWLLGSLAAGALFQKMDGHRIVWIALLLMSAMHCVIPFIPQFSVLFGAFGVIGLAGGVLEAGGNTLLIWTWRNGVGPYLQFLNFSIGVGALLSPLGMAALLTEESAEFSVIACYVSLAALMLPPLFFLASFRSPTAVVEEERDEEKPARSVCVLAAMCVFTLAISGIEISSSSFLPLFAKDTFPSWPLAKCDLTTSLFYGSFALARLMFSFPTSRFISGAKLFFLLIFVLIVGTVLLVVAQFLVSGVLIFVSVGVLAAGLGPLFAMALSLPIDSPAKILLSAPDVAMVVAASNVGELGTPLILSLVWSVLAAKAFLVTTSAMSLLTLVSGVWLISSMSRGV